MKLDSNYLSGLIKERGFTKSYICKCLGMKPATFYNKSHGVTPFTYEEATRLIKLLKITKEEEQKIFCPKC